MRSAESKRARLNIRKDIYEDKKEGIDASLKDDCMPRVINRPNTRTYMNMYCTSYIYVLFVFVRVYCTLQQSYRFEIRNYYNLTTYGRTDGKWEGARPDQPTQPLRLPAITVPPACL